jgi:ubiquinone biosynthesis monooxygenase Coq7
MAEPESERARLIRRILRVNHAGEHGAIAIYTAQIAVMGTRNADLTTWLREKLSHELRHRDRFHACMRSRQTKPCRAMFVWKVGGKLLGYGTALLGRFGVMACTAAVERVVHMHLAEQITFLMKSDTELETVVRDIIREEDQHLFYAETHHNAASLPAIALSRLVAALTETLIFISTRGDSLRLGRELKQADYPRPR